MSPTQVVPTFEMLVETARLRRVAVETEHKTVDEEGDRKHIEQQLQTLRKDIKDAFTSECCDLLCPLLNFDLHKWPGTTPDEEEGELIGAKFTFSWENENIVCLIGQDNADDWHLHWIDKAGSSHSEEFAVSDHRSAVKWTRERRTENLYRALADAYVKRNVLAKEAAARLEKALARERLTRDGRWRVEQCPVSKLQDTLNTFQTTGLEIKYLFPPLPQEIQEFVVVAWKKGVGPSSI